jgi:hypothetical protein
VAEAALLLAAAGVAQRAVPIVRWSSVLGRPAAVPEGWRGQRVAALPARAATRTERAVAVAVRGAARRLPWKPTCLAEATAAQVLLRQAGEPGVVVIGLRPPAPGEGGPWPAHAWLLGRAGALTGGAEARSFTATTVYEVPGGLTAAELVAQP